MKYVSRFAVWLVWNIVYFFRRRPLDLDEVLLKGKRCWWPWKKFTPSAWHNDDGHFWHVWFTDEEAYTEHRTIDVECHIGMESGDIVGLNVWDKMLLFDGKTTRIAEDTD